jgi:hypothetical protein
MAYTYIDPEVALSSHRCCITVYPATNSASPLYTPLPELSDNPNQQTAKRLPGDPGTRTLRMCPCRRSAKM